jgi:NADH:ubiquinone oxidoreductase subunit 6 (subunit J)
MRFAGQWSDSKEPLEGAWLDMGYIVGDVGLVVLLVTTGVGWWSARRLERRWPARGVTVLATVYLAALLVTMWAMTTKPD